jgi:fibro-slime domain-containing protein
MADFDSEAEFNLPDPDGGGVFRLGEIFTRLGNNIYFVADELDPSDPNAGWYGTDPGYNDESRCKFELAAFIYDTDPSVHPDFSCGSWVNGLDEGNGASTKGACEEGPAAYSTTNGGKIGNLKPQCTGVVKGLAAQRLGEGRKIQCGNCTKNGCWTSADWFNQAFTSTKGVNVERCYNMPFTQIKTGTSADGAGSFEFDSDKMTQTGNTRLIGGFFPELLNSRGTDDYSQCSSCDTKRSADRFPPRITAITKDMFDRYQSKEGDFKDGDSPPRSAFGITQEPTGSIYDWNARNEANTTNPNWSAWYLHGTTALKNTYGSDKTGYDAAAKANQHFCFESHAEFMYDPEQVFYFSGDDPIWVYIDNELVIDLGGAHMAAPGSVKLNTLGLDEGKMYPIDIFFCDQRTVNSNVRVSTNMYIAQKSSFASDPQKQDQPFCANIQKGADCASKMGVATGGSGKPMCGNELITGGYTVELYLVRRGTTDTTWLSATRNPADCQGTGNAFSCFKGINVNNAVYTCGGYGQCKGRPDASSKVDLTGNFNVYARLMEDGKQVPGSKPILVDNIKSESNTRIIWGNLNSEDGKVNEILKNAYGVETSGNQRIISGKRTPVYIASGVWNDGRTFVYDDDPEFVEGKAYTLTIIGQPGLTIYRNEGDATPLSTGGSVSGNLPRSGIDTLWVEGGYTGEKSFTLNVTQERDDAPSMKLTVYLPVLKFTEKGFSPVINATNGYARWTGTEIPYVGSPLDIYIAAVDPERNNEICSHCNFLLTENSKATSACNMIRKTDFVSSGGGITRIESGKFSGDIHGNEATGGDQSCTNSWSVSGPSPTIAVEWTGLRFKDAPVPIPMTSFIWDRNGDGIGDSVMVKFNKSFNGKGDSLLPVLLEVVWEEGDTVSFHVDTYSKQNLMDPNFVEQLYRNTPGFFAANRAYWQQFLREDTLIVIARPTERFSQGILTSGKGSVISRIPFIDTDGCPSGRNCPLTYNPNNAALLDRISPIVVKAEYKYADNNPGNCDAQANPGCRETLVVYLSEPVFSSEEAQNSIYDWKNPFSYCFQRSQGMNCNPNSTGNIDSTDRYRLDYNNLNWNWEEAKARFDGDTSSTVTYKPTTKGFNAMAQIGTSKGDSIVELVYYAYKTTDGGTTRKPKSDDWVKIRLGKVYVDAENNYANPMERGVLITGTNPSKKRPIRIAEIKGHGPESPILGGIFDPKDPGYFPPPWYNDAAIGRAQDLYKPGVVAEFLPVPKSYSDPDSIKIYYPGSVGTVFDIADRIHNDVGAFIDECDNIPGSCRDAGGNLITRDNIAEHITIRASAYYHTNLGDYTAHRDPVAIGCTDPLFQNAGGGNCYTNEYNYYLAWDLKANNNRFVGAGAYVGISKFYVQIDYYNAAGSKKSKKLSQEEFIEMFGVRRGHAVK